MRVIVCGGRNYSDVRRVEEQLETLNIRLLITGGARGADELAYDWAMKRGCPVCVFPANWNVNGKAAGPIRNGWMLEHGKPDLVVAFPGGTGTLDMIHRARIAGVAVERIA